MADPNTPAEHHDHLDPLVHLAQVDHPDEVAEARARAGRAVRDLGHALVGRQAPIELIDDVTDQLNRLTTSLELHGPRSRSAERPRGDWGPTPGEGAPMTSYDERPVSGRSSPWGLDLAIRREGDEAVAAVTLRAAHEGAPSRSHGGIVAALFDDVFGFVLTIHSQPAFTGELTIRYEAGTPIGRPLECRVRLSGRDGRKLRMTGELNDLGSATTVARAHAVFIAIDPEQFAVGS